jgi:hypothetical protein
VKSSPSRVLVPALAVLLVAAVALATLLVVERAHPDATAGGEAAAQGKVCTPSADRPGPLLDLGVQAGTGDPDAPLLPPDQVATLVDRAVGAGADVVSTDVSWESVLPTPDATPLFDALDLVLDAAQERGLAVRVQLTGSPAWAVDGGGDDDRWTPPTTRAELGRWRAFVGLVLRHLDGRADYVEIWSEPDEAAYWGGSPDPAAYARLLRATEPVVRRLAPRSILVTGGLGGNDLGYLDQLYDALGEDRPFDLVGVHPFSGSLPPFAASPTALSQGPFGAYDASFLGYRALHDVMAEHGDARRGLYVGEFGYSTEEREGMLATPDRVRADYVGQALGAATCTPYVVALSWYYLHPTAWDDPSWTLLDEQGEPNLTYEALATWARSRP